MAPPINDDVADAIDLLVGTLKDAVSGTIIDATIEADFEGHAPNNWDSQSVWYHFVPTDDSRVALKVTKTGGDAGFVPEADVWECTTYPPATSDDFFFRDYAGDGTGTPPYEHFWPVTAGTHYLISVEDFNYDPGEEGDFDLEIQLVPSYLFESWEDATIDPLVWEYHYQGTSDHANPNTGPWTIETSQVGLGSQSLLVTPPQTFPFTHGLTYIDNIEGGDVSRDYWVAFKFYVPDWNDVWMSGSGDIPLPTITNGNDNDFPHDFGLLAAAFNHFLSADTSTTGLYSDLDGNDYSLSDGAWHELRTRYRKQSGQMRVTQILDGTEILSDVDIGSFGGSITGVSWRTDGGGLLYIDPLVWSPDSDPGALVSADSISVPFIAPATALYAPAPTGSGSVDLDAPFIDPETVVFDAELATASIFAPFISATLVFAPYLSGPQDILAPFIAPTTAVFEAFLLGADRVRLTQEPVEALLLPTDAKGRLTQEPVEALLLPTDAKVRATQAPVEVLVLVTDAALRFTQDVVEVLILPTDASVRETQAAVEVLRRRQVGSVFVAIID